MGASTPEGVAFAEPTSTGNARSGAMCTRSMPTLKQRQDLIQREARRFGFDRCETTFLGPSDYDGDDGAYEILVLPLGNRTRLFDLERSLEKLDAGAIIYTVETAFSALGSSKRALMRNYDLIEKLSTAATRTLVVAVVTAAILIGAASFIAYRAGEASATARLITPVGGE